MKRQEIQELIDTWTGLWVNTFQFPASVQMGPFRKAYRCTTL
ncbi:MAG: hypothetical protein WD266_10785 [Balneolales bacterium]